MFYFKTKFYVSWCHEPVLYVLLAIQNFIRSNRVRGFWMAPPLTLEELLQKSVKSRMANKIK